MVTLPTSLRSTLKRRSQHKEVVFCNGLGDLGLPFLFYSDLADHQKNKFGGIRKLVYLCTLNHKAYGAQHLE